MFYECRVDGTAEPFFAWGPEYEDARRMARETLEGLGLPKVGLRMKQVKDRKKLFQATIAGVSFLSHGSTWRRARARAWKFLDSLAIHAKGLHIKKWRRNANWQSFNNSVGRKSCTQTR